MAFLEPAHIVQQRVRPARFPAAPSALCCSQHNTAGLSTMALACKPGLAVQTAKRVHCARVFRSQPLCNAAVCMVAWRASAWRWRETREQSARVACCDVCAGRSLGLACRNGTAPRARAHPHAPRSATPNSADSTEVGTASTRHGSNTGVGRVAAPACTRGRGTPRAWHAPFAVCLHLNLDEVCRIGDKLPDCTGAHASEEAFPQREAAVFIAFEDVLAECFVYHDTGA